MGADFSGVRVHTDTQSDQLNRSIQAKAFTTGQDVFFRSGEYNPGSKGGQELIAHELTHVVQQNGSTVQKKGINQTNASVDSIQRVTYDYDLKKYYSEVLEGQQIDETNGVITATSKNGFRGGHTAIYTERLLEGNPDHTKIDLTLGDGKSSDSQPSMTTDSSSGSGSSTGGGKGVKINIKPGFKPRDTDEPVRKSWVVNASKINLLLHKAEEIKRNQSNYSYTLLGVSPIKKNILNCAKFGEIILKAAGIDVSAGKLFKFPDNLTKGDDVGYEKDQDYVEREEQKKEGKKYKTFYKILPKFEEYKVVSGTFEMNSRSFDETFIFVSAPLSDNEISLKPTKIEVTELSKEYNCAVVWDRSKRFYIQLEDIVKPDGTIITD